MDIKGALAQGCPVEDADLTDVGLRESIREISMPATLRRCVLDDVDLHGLDLSGLVLQDCSLSGAVLRGAVLDRLEAKGGNWANVDPGDCGAVAAHNTCKNRQVLLDRLPLARQIESDQHGTGQGQRHDA